MRLCILFVLLLCFVCIATPSRTSWLDELGVERDSGTPQRKINNYDANLDLTPINHHELAVKLGDEHTYAQLEKTAKQHHFEVVGEISPGLPDFKWYKLRRHNDHRFKDHPFESMGMVAQDLGVNNRHRGLPGITHVAPKDPDWDKHIIAARASGVGHTVYDDAGFLSQWQHDGKSVVPGESEPRHVSDFHLRTSLMWERGVRGSNRTIVQVVDTGSRHDIDELFSKNKKEWNLDLLTPDGDGMTSSRATHGTSCAGLCCGSGTNGELGVGTCPECPYVDVRMLGRSWLTLDEQEARALSNHASSCVGKKCRMLYSCSWGNDDSGKDLLIPHKATADAMAYAEEMGNGFVWAAGNGGSARKRDHTAYDLFVASPHNVIAIGGVTRSGRRPWYGEIGPSIMAVAPTSGDLGVHYPDGVYTVANKDAVGHWYTWFTGTSASAPEAAGVIALIWDQFPDLTFRDMMHIVAHGSSHHPGLHYEHGMEKRTNGVGIEWSDAFGAGVLNAEKMYDVASRWNTKVSPRITLTRRMWMEAPDGISEDKQYAAHIAPADTVELKVEIADADLITARDMNGDTKTFGCVEKAYAAIRMSVFGGWKNINLITMTSPAGTLSKLIVKNRLPGSPIVIPLGTNHNWGEGAKGLWTVRIKLGAGHRLGSNFLADLKGVDLYLSGNSNCAAPTPVA